ncbi:MAG: hypothetical protein KKB50_14915 [Planctomycetes bacterium]|nr:hypothetical protein [Planctomycetota bacterium]
MCRPSPHSLTLVCVATAALWTGCAATPANEYERQISRLERTIAEKDHQLVAQKATIDELHRRLATARAFTPEQLAHIFYPETLVIDSLTGGADYDGQPGDDGVTVYLKPTDRAGDTVKVAGDIRITLYDLANPPDQTLVGEYVIPADQAGPLWYGRLMTHHYTIRCPWLTGPPRHAELTIRASFVDYLTQRAMTAQTTCTVELPP